MACNFVTMGLCEAPASQNNCPCATHTAANAINGSGNATVFCAAWLVPRQHLGALGPVWCIVAVRHCANYVSHRLLYCVSSGLQYDTIGLLV